MSQKTIAELAVFVILVGILAGCVTTSSAPPPDPHSPYVPPVRVGTLQLGDINEASGLAASKCQKDVLWTHNDSGDGPYVYALRPNGEDLGTWRVPNARNLDWEDIAEYKDASGKCFLYIGEIGDNDGRRAEHLVYRVPEPSATTDGRGSEKRETGPAEVAKFTYPDRNQNAETLLVHPLTGDVYVVTKHMSGPAGVYKVKAAFGADTQPAVLIAEVSVPAIPNGLLTGGDISPDGRKVILSDYMAGYEWTLPANTPFDRIWATPFATVDIGKRDTGEAICYSSDGNSLFSTSEGDHAPIYQMKLK